MWTLRSKSAIKPKFYFKQVMYHAVASTAGITAVSVFNPAPYVGESITYTATLASENEVIMYYTGERI